MDMFAKMIEIAALCILVVMLVDWYIHMRKRWFQGSSQLPSTPAASFDAAGGLTTGAKYAIRNYMLGIFGVAAAIIGIIAGIAGYMINDLTKQSAIQTAIADMQQPLKDRLAKFATAESALETATKKVGTADFQITVATQLSNDRAFQASVAKALVDQHVDQLRGPIGPVGPAGSTGPAGPAGKDGMNGTSPSVASVAQALDDAPFRTKVAELLVDQYGGQLRGAGGPPGPAGPAGKEGANGTSANAESVADVLNTAAFRTELAKVLFAQHGSDLHGPAGPTGSTGPAGKDGKDGANGISPSASSVAQALNDAVFRNKLAEVLFEHYGSQLHGPVGPAGPTGPAGKDGRNGPGAAEVAEFLVRDHGDQLRGPQGVPGKDGKNGTSPSVDEVATVLVSKHGDQLRRILSPRPAFHARVTQ